MSLLSEKGQEDIVGIIKVIFIIVVLAWVGWIIAATFDYQETIIEIGKTVLIILSIPAAYFVYRILDSEIAAIIVFLAWIGILTPIVLGAPAIIVLSGAGIVAAGVFSMYLGIHIHRSKKEAAELRQKMSFEEEQHKKGLVRFVDKSENEKWGTPKEVEKWRTEDEKARIKEREAKIKESKLYRILEAIEDFEPARKYGHELPYQTELCGWLKSKFPNTDIEIQRGSSRPDIVIDDEIAIEVKDPTSVRELKDLPDKMRYLRHFKELIIVLFELEVSEERYEETEELLKEYFPNVKIIVKD